MNEYKQRRPGRTQTDLNGMILDVRRYADPPGPGTAHDEFARRRALVQIDASLGLSVVAYPPRL